MDFFLWAIKIIEMIRECRENQSRAEIERGLSNPGFLQKWAIRKLVRQNTKLRGRALWAKVREGMDELRDLDSDDIKELMDEAENQ